MPTSPRQRTRIDWNAARAFYVSLGPDKRSYVAISREFRVSEPSIRKHARGGKCLCCPAEGWPAEAARADQAAGEKAAAQAQRSLDQRAADMVRVAEMLRERVLEATKADIPLDVAVRELRKYHQLERVMAGEASDVIAIQDAQQVVRALMQAPEPALAAALVAAGVGEQLAAKIVAGFREQYLEHVDRATAPIAGAAA